MPSLLQTLVLTLRPSLVRFLTSRGASPEEAEDLAQDLFIKAGLSKERPISEPKAYLYRMADNLFLDRRRSALRQQRREEDWASHSGGLGPEVAHPLADDDLNIRHQLAVVEEALSSLPDRTADIFRRFRVDGERQKAIALDLGISVSAVEKHLQRAYDVVLRARARIDTYQMTHSIETMKVKSRG
ncbi:MAG TPA: RNA polymerase sigma factor [Bauldia sp.]|nr:RNA polymerase sigma factor [Bauldia sp.]